MEVKTLIKKSEYHDSVTLMLVAKELTNQPGVKDAAVLMGTEANKAMLKQAGMLTTESNSASPNDLVIAVFGVVLPDGILALAETLLSKKPAAGSSIQNEPGSIRGALKAIPDINFAIISTAGRYATRETWAALRNGLHVLLFSDNVSLEDEKALKEYAVSQGLLVMGPGAGTAIINGVGLGFANAMPKGKVGIVSAAGTGLQEVSTLLAKRGVGISQAIGTGGRDLHREIGGLMFLAATDALAEDPGTEKIILVSKPPDTETARKIILRAQETKKEVIICFLGMDTTEKTKEHVHLVRTLEEAAYLGSLLDDKKHQVYSEFLNTQSQQNQQIANEIRKGLNPGQKYLRGLFSGGTLCYEAQVIWKQEFGRFIHSNAPLDKTTQLKDSTRSVEHSIIDLGEEEFTVGRLHPMIDNDLRTRRLLQEVDDPEVAVILMDMVIGYGSHPDPASELAQAFIKAQSKLEKVERKVAFIASVTGTEQDPQRLSRTENILKDAGVIVCPSNAAAARLAAMVVGAK